MPLPLGIPEGPASRIYSMSNLFSELGVLVRVLVWVLALVLEIVPGITTIGQSNKDEAIHKSDEALSGSNYSWARQSTNQIRQYE